jgi:uncharacterized protein YbjT (DUF2867 family)
MKTLVIGGTGLVGSQVVRELLQRNAEVTVLTRSAEKAKALPSGVQAVVGDLLRVDTVRSIFRGVDGVFLLNPVSPTETQEGLMAVTGARNAGVRRLVYQSIHAVEEAAFLPHFGSKVAIEAGVKASGIPYTIVRPNSFFQVDPWFKDAMLQQGVYPQPLGSAGLSRVDIRDIAEAAAIALTTGGHEGQTYNVVGPDVLTGPGTAEAWGRALGREIRYAGEDMDAWERQSLQYLPALMVFDFRLMYEFFQKQGLRATREDVDRLTKVLGHPPRRFQDFVRETAEMWTRTSSGVTA